MKRRRFLRKLHWMCMQHKSKIITLWNICSRKACIMNTLIHAVRRFRAPSVIYSDLTCKTRLGKPVFCDNCLRSLASGLWFIAKYDFIVRNWWCLNDVLIRFVRDDVLPMLPRPKPKSIYSELRSERKEMFTSYNFCDKIWARRLHIFSLLILWFIVAWSLFN